MSLYIISLKESDHTCVILHYMAPLISFHFPSGHLNVYRSKQILTKHIITNLEGSIDMLSYLSLLVLSLHVCCITQYYYKILNELTIGPASTNNKKINK